jgi:hypothetical protein
MNDAILKKLEEKKLNRRSFLRGSGLAAAAFLGAAALPRLASAQDQQPSDKKDGDGDKGDKKDEPEDEFKVTHKDEQGREYRVCPQCGFHMYRQERTWTCENCGYSYNE